MTRSIILNYIIGFGSPEENVTISKLCEAAQNLSRGQGRLSSAESVDGTCGCHLLR